MTIPEDKKRPFSKQAKLIVAIILIGIVLSLIILGTEKKQSGTEGNGHEKGAESVEAKDSGEKRHVEDDVKKGPHGGKLFIEDGYGVEVTIFEQGTAPQFRIYVYQNGKPLDTASSTMSLTLKRLGQPVQTVTFSQEKDYFKSNSAVEEPHSFDVIIMARHNNKSYQFTYSQVEERVTMSDQQLKQNGIQILTAGSARIKNTLQLQGEIRLNEDLTVHMVPGLPGVVQSVSANAGDRVRKGQLLAVIASQALADQRSVLLAGQKLLKLTRITYEREKKLWEDKISAEQDYLEARHNMQKAEIEVQTAQQKLAAVGATPGNSSNLARYEIRAPIDGVVTGKNVAIGEALKEDANIFVVADLSTVWAEMIVPAKDINVIEVGQTASIYASAVDMKSSGDVSYVGALVGEQTRTAKARVVLSNPKGLWRPGLPVTIALVTNEVEVPTAVSIDALQTVRDWTVVFGRYGDQFETRPLELGRRDDTFVEVVKGLKAGERYAAKNSFLIKAEVGKSSASHDN